MRAARVDANQSKIVSAFKEGGATVALTSKIGEGMSDIIVSISNVTKLVEIKDGDKPPSQRKLTPAQRDFHESWPDKIYIVKDISDVRVVLQEMQGISNLINEDSDEGIRNDEYVGCINSAGEDC